MIYTENMTVAHLSIVYFHFPTFRVQFLDPSRVLRVKFMSSLLY
jgi:hypothetical protein